MTSVKTDHNALDDAEEAEDKKAGQNKKSVAKAMAKIKKTLAKKEAKMMAVVSKQINAEVTTTQPTEWVVLWGPNLTLGSSKEQVVNLFDPPPEEVRFYNNKPYCTIRFANAADAAKAKKEKSGGNLTETQLMYLGFIKEEPPKEDSELISPFEVDWPVGLRLYTDFITEEEEDLIIASIIPSDMADSVELGQSLKRRWVRHYGHEFDYNTNGITANSVPEFPNSVLPVIERMLESHIIPRKPEQLTVNHYLPGQGIPPHVDTHSVFDSPLISLSLKGPTVMDFRDGQKHFSLILPPRSLLVMTDEARYQWTHGITNRTFDIIPDEKYGGITASTRKPRTSLTFRLLRQSKVCDCRFPFMCDSQKGKITEENASQLEKSLVHEVYEDIAQHFSTTRHTAWPKVKEFVQNLKSFDTLVDVGCGNGKYLNLRPGSFEIGTDMSGGLLDICREKKNAEVIKSNCLTLPFKDGSFDAAICIAVLHHLSTKERRLKAIQEILRVLRHDGEALIYVWSKNQKVADVKSSYAQKQDSKDPNAPSRKCLTPIKNYSFLPIHSQEADFTHNDLIVPWLTGPESSQVYHRYYHVFNEGELEDLIQEVAPSPEILESYYDQGNWCVRLKNRVIIT